MWVGWVIEGLLLSARFPPQLADLQVPPEQGKFFQLGVKIKTKKFRKIKIEKKK